MQTELCKREDCTGCLACMQVCMQDAIHVEVSDDGFAYPVIDRDKCIGCNACVKSCPVISLQAPYRYNSDSHCYCAYQKTKSVRRKSSSGGLFYTLAKHVLDQGGVVYGAAWSTDLRLKHTEACDEQTLEKLLRSKYVQSDTSEAFTQARKRLEEGRLVLFCGTPCQVAAMKSFLRGKEYDNLLLVDVICQGVPSPGIFRKYIDEVEAKYRTRIVDVTFRSKKYGWRAGLLCLFLSCEDGRTIEVKYDKNSYYRAFLRNYFLRESCFNCQFKTPHKGCFSDITLADFWRIGNQVPFRCNTYECGISAVLTNTIKGEKTFDAIKEDIVWEERSFEEFSTNGGLRVAKKPEHYYSSFVSAMSENFNTIQAKYFPYTKRSFFSDWLSMHFSQQTINKTKKWKRRLL